MKHEWLPPQYGCKGLCAGDSCTDCAELADQISQAKRRPFGPERSAWLLILSGRVADVMGGRGSEPTDLAADHPRHHRGHLRADRRPGVGVWRPRRGAGGKQTGSLP